jgi:hypothetical protein
MLMNMAVISAYVNFDTIGSDLRLSADIFLFKLGTQIATAGKVKDIHEGLHDRLWSDDLNMCGWSADHRCLTGTRTRYISRIMEWVNNPGPVLCWLN